MICMCSIMIIMNSFCGMHFQWLGCCFSLWLHKEGRVGGFSLQGARCCCLCFTQEGRRGRLYTYREPYAAVCALHKKGRVEDFTGSPLLLSVPYTRRGEFLMTSSLTFWSPWFHCKWLTTTQSLQCLWILKFSGILIKA